MTVVVFCGPTISPEDVAVHVEAVCLPPVAQGDVYRALELKPQAIGIIDGCFQGVPAVWHKEILWALSQGVAVYGSASMGALRAAELHAMGMRGVGRIFDDYRNGALQDDDEVAVVHGPAEMGYMALGEAMVNVRATMERAVREGAVEPLDADAFCERAKAMFYQHRSWERLLAEAGDVLADAKGFQCWLETGRVDQKRLDAEAMLEVMKQDIAAGNHRPAVDFDFETTLVWQRLTQECGRRTLSVERLVLDEIALDPDRYVPLRRQAEVRALALAAEPPAGGTVEPETLKKALAQFRQDKGLFSQAGLEQWLVDNGLDADGLAQHLAEGVLTGQVLAQAADEINAHIIALLKLSGAYRVLRQRAEDKAEVLAAADLEGAELDQTGLLPVQLAGWYFEDRLQQTMPEHLGRYAQGHGFDDLDAFINCLARERLYLTLRADA
jgi:hypothetical protein